MKHILRLNLKAAYCLVLLSLLPAFLLETKVYAQESVVATPRIVGGQEATQGAWPFMAEVDLKVASGFQFLCGGSLIASKWVVTAAHCVKNGANVINTSDIQVVLNVHDRNAMDKAEKIEVTRIIAHPDYRDLGNYADYDIALLELKTASKMTPIEMVQPSSSSSTASFRSSPSLTGYTATVIGWGQTVASNPNNIDFSSKVLKQVSFPVVSNRTCEPKYASDGITDRMLCAGRAEGGVDSCYGDSGGPLIVKSGGKWKLAGIVSGGGPTGQRLCAQRGYYGVYTRVSEFTSFISQYVTATTTTTGSSSGSVTLIPSPTTTTTTTGSGDTTSSTTTTGSGTSTGSSSGSGSTSSPTNSAAVTTGLTLPVELTGPYGLWNGFLGMTNVLELENTTSAAKSADVYLIRSNGVPGSKLRVDLGANSKQDIILNELPGFAADAYGVIKVVGSLSGRIFYYRTQGSAFANFEFAFSVTLKEAMTDSSFVNFNTNQPSLAGEDQDNLVANWLSVVNLSSGAKTFLVRKYNQSGVAVSSTSVTVGSYERVDLDGGHIVPGVGNVGLIEVIPQNGGEYLAQLMRYGYGSNGSFDFAFPLNAVPVSTQTTAVALSTMSNSQNWVELSNASSVTSPFRVEFYDQAGSLSGTQSVTLDPHSQRHFNVNSVIGDSAIGHALIVPEGSAPAVAESMYYFRSTSSGKVLSMYGSQARATFSTEHVGAYNLYLGMSNYLKLSNPGNSGGQIELVVLSGSSELASKRIFVPPHGSIDVPLHDSHSFNTAKNTYGVVKIKPGTYTNLIGEVLRLRYDPSGTEFEFVAPTDLQ